MPISVSKANFEDGRAAALLHQQTLRSGFLSQLPVKFLTSLYQNIFASPHSFGFLAKDRNEAVGFIAGVTDISKFYRWFLCRKGLPAVFILLTVCFKKNFFRMILETLFYPFRPPASLPEAELLSIGVSFDQQGQGVGELLLEELKKEFARREILEFKVIVSKQLKAAHQFYEKKGGKKAGGIKIHADAESEIYIFRTGESL